MKYRIPSLPCAVFALVPCVSEEALEYRYRKHGWVPDHAHQGR
jgi:superoxide dismutase